MLCEHVLRTMREDRQRAEATIRLPGEIGLCVGAVIAEAHVDRLYPWAARH